MKVETRIANLESQVELGEFRLNSLLELTRAIATNQSIEHIVRMFEFVMREQLGFDHFFAFQ